MSSFGTASFGSTIDSEAVALIRDITACNTRRVPKECFTNVPWLHNTRKGDGVLNVVVGTMPNKDENDILKDPHVVWMHWYSPDTDPTSPHGMKIYRNSLPGDAQQGSGLPAARTKVDWAEVNWAHPNLSPVLLLTPAGRKLVPEGDREEVHQRWLLCVWQHVIRHWTKCRHRTELEKSRSIDPTHGSLFDTGVSPMSERVAPSELAGELKLAQAAKVVAESEEHRLGYTRARNTTNIIGIKEGLAALTQKLAAAQRN
ncbi:hypothetical protein B0A48_11481 [Cryoendolithus antarcticus]|uniref:Uncharacterized protein n=1 Tax=Cryoendolithus antarcticus TaxID=1507870 RepID=A0A1V8SVM4_9PEZI|nr:hypothetical protein B0A48_11481 [Cryoendolithus antarcticus]